jgi:hypothetical protein
MLKFIRVLVMVGLVSALLFTAQPAHAAPLHAWPGNTQNWYSYNFGGAPVPSFANGPDAPPLGTGSFGIHAPATVPQYGGAGIGRGDFVGTPLSSLNITYWAYNSDTSANNWRIKLYINTTGGPSANCALEYVHLLPAANAWSQKAPTAAAGGYTPSGGWVIRSDEFTSPPAPCNVPPNWGSPHPWSTITSTFSSATLAPNASTTTIVMQIYNNDPPLVSGVIDAVTINGTTWNFEFEPPPVPPAEFFNPGDGRYNPQPGDRLAAYCEAKRVLIYGVNRNSRGFLMGIFEFEALKQAGEKGIYLDKGVDGILSASMGPQGHIWVAWTGGQYNASGRPEHGFAKLVKCGG